MYKKTLLFISTVALAATTPDGVRLKVTPACTLDTSAPFRHSHTVELFDIALKDGAFKEAAGNIEKMYIWADGKNYHFYSRQPQIDTPAGIKGPNQLFKEELRSIMSAGYIKLLVKYTDQVNEEYSSQGKSPYFTTVRTTVETEEYLPVVLDKNEITQAFDECTQTVVKEKRRQSIAEIMIGTLGASAVIGILWFFRKTRRKKAKDDMQE